MVKKLTLRLSDEQYQALKEMVPPGVTINGYISNIIYFQSNLPAGHKKILKILSENSLICLNHNFFVEQLGFKRRALDSFIITCLSEGLIYLEKYDNIPKGIIVAQGIKRQTKCYKLTASGRDIAQKLNRNI